MSASENPARPEHPYSGDPVFDLHVGGKMGIRSAVELAGAEELSLDYTPGVARVCEAIAAHPELTHPYTWLTTTVTVVTDVNAVLGLRDIGPAAAMTVMESKAGLFIPLGNVNCNPN